MEPACRTNVKISSNMFYSFGSGCPDPVQCAVTLAPRSRIQNGQTCHPPVGAGGRHVNGVSMLPEYMCATEMLFQPARGTDFDL